MIGHYLLTLTPEQEDRVLTGQMVGFDPDGGFAINEGDRCLVMVALGSSSAEGLPETQISRVGEPGKRWPWATQRYDGLCARSEEQRVNAAIRNRILANQARRALRDAPQLVEA